MRQRYRLDLFNKRRTVYFGELPGDSDFLQIQSNWQKYWGKMMADMFGSSTPVFTGLAVTAGTGFSISIGTGNAYQQIAADATAWGSTAHGLPADSTVITKQGCVETALANQFSGSFAAPGSGTNYYTLEAQLADSDQNSQTITFNPQPGVFSNQTLMSDRVTGISFQVKGPSNSSPPAADAGWFTVATIAIPAGATGMLNGYITMASQFPGFAGILAGGAFVQLSPGSPQSGFLSLSGAGTFGGAVTANSLAVTTTAVLTGLATANGGINCNGVLNANAQAVLGTSGAAGVPLTVQGVAGGGQTAPLIQGLLQASGTLLFQVDAGGAISFGNPNAVLKVTGTATKLIPGASRPFALRNAGDSTNLISSDNNGNVTINKSLVVGNPAVLTCDASGNLTGNGQITLIGSVWDSTGTTAQNATSTTASITLPAGGTWDVIVLWTLNSISSNTVSISVSAGTVTGFQTNSCTIGPGSNPLPVQAFGQAAGGQTVSFNLSAAANTIGAGIWTIRAVRVA